MSAPPYMKLFWGDYHKATRHLTRDQHGAYFLLIGEAWRLGGSLPDDDKMLAAWALCSPAEWAGMKDTILAFFNLRRGKWVHDRVRAELAHYDDVSRKRKSAGKKGGSATCGKDEEIPQAFALQMPTKPEPEPEPKEEATASSSGDDAPKSKPRRKPKVRLPDGFPDAEALDDARNRAASAGKELNAATEAERFRNHALQVDRIASDWRAAWRNWIITALEKAPAKAGGSNSAPLLAAIAKFPNGPIRAAVVEAKTEPFAVSYLDTCRFVEDGGVKTIVAPNSFIAKKLRDGVPSLERRGARITVETHSPGVAA